MTNVINQTKKVFTTAVAAATIAWSVSLSAFLAPLTAQAAIPPAGSLVKASLPAVYYLGTDGKRYVFPNEKTYKTWYADFSSVVVITDAELASLPIGGNVTYRPGVLMVKITTDPKVYAVDAHGALRWVTSEAVATCLYGASWNTMIHDVPDAFFTNYTSGPDINTCADFNPATATSLASSINVDKNLSSTPSGSVSVSTASSNPMASSVIEGQATADLAHFAFTGTGSVTKLVLQRTGISNNDVLANVYLYQGNTRISDSATVNTSGEITFANAAGLFTVPATISVRADIEDGNFAGQTVGVSFKSGMSGAANISGSAAGNIHNVANADLAEVELDPNTVSTGTVDAGSMEYSIWSAPLDVSQRSVWLKGAAFQVTGSAPSDSVQNFDLFVDGMLVTSTAGLQSIDGTNYAVFNPTTPFTVNTGNHTLEVRADIVKGSGRDFRVRLQNQADLMVADSSFGVNIAADGIPNSAGTLTINEGVVTVERTPSFNNVSTVVGGASNAVIAMFDLTAYGEDVQVNELDFDIDGSALDNSFGTEGLQDITLYASGRGQIGSARQLDFGGNNIDPFTLGSSLIIAAGETVTLEVRADLTDEDGDTIEEGELMVTMLEGDENAQGRSSHELLDVPSGDVEGVNLEVSISTLTVAKDASYANQTFAPNTQGRKIGSFVLQAGSSEAVRVSSLKVNMNQQNGNTDLTNTANDGVWPALTNFSALRISVNGGTPTNPINPQANNTFSQNFVIPANGTATVEVWANLGSEDDGEQFNVDLEVTARGDSSNADASDSVKGQLITLASGDLNDVVLSVSASDESRFVPAFGGSAVGAVKNVFTLTATGGAVTVTELNFSVADSNTMSSIKIGNTTYPVVNNTVNATGLSINVPEGVAGYNLEVLSTYSPVGINGTDSQTVSTLTLDSVKFSTGSGTDTDTFNEPGNTMMLVGSRPHLTNVPVNGSIALGDNELAKVTVAADAKGAIRLYQIVFNVNSSGITGFDVTDSWISNVGGTVITGFSCDESAGPATLITVTCDAGVNGYDLAAGASQTLVLHGVVAGTIDGDSSVSTSLGAADSFVWADIAGNDTGAIDTENLTYFSNYPTGTWTRD